MMKWIFRWVVLNIAYVFIGSFLLSMEWLNEFYFAAGYFVLLAFNLVLIGILWKKKYLKKNIIYILMVIYAFLSILATVLAVNVERSVFGDKDWREGLLVILYYISLMAVGSTLDKKYKKKVIITLLVFGAIECAYGICQAFRAPFVRDVQHFIGRVNGKKTYETWSTGFVGNPNFFSTLVLLFLGYAISLFVDEKPGKKSALYLALVALFMFGIMVGNTMSCVVGLACMLIFLIVFTIKFKKIPKLVSLICTIVAVVFMAIILGKTKLVNDVSETFFQASEMAQGNVEDNYGTKRVYIWKNALEVAPSHLWHGTGLDGFCDAFPGDCLRSKDGTKRINKAHNEYLQILIAEGIFAFLTYLLICGIVVCRGVKDGFRNKAVLFILSVIGYLVQAFFNISVIGVAPLFFLAMGLCIDNERGKKILVVGNFGADGKRDGQTVKTQTVTKTLEKIYDKNVKTVDTHTTGFWGKIRFIFLVLGADTVFIMCAKGSLRSVVKALEFARALKKTNYIVIGGWLYEYTAKDEKLLSRLKKMNAVLVETKSLERKLSRLGVKAKTIPNYRIYGDAPVFKKKGDKYVFYSRIIKEKGILTAIDAVRVVGDISLDVYGPVDKDFEKEFKAAMKGNKNIKYRGVLGNEKTIVEILSQYKVLLFPTYYDGEGVPGTIVEAMSAGVPVVASDWKYNSEIIKDGKTGIIVKDNSVAGFKKAIKRIESGKIDLEEMSKNCLKEASKYTEKNAVRILESIVHE